MIAVRNTAAEHLFLPSLPVRHFTQAPPSFTRYATAACLLIVRQCGALGAASLLGLWRPPRGIVWQSRSRQPADAGAAAAGLPGTREAGDAAAEAPAAMEEDDEAAAAAAAQAAAAFQEQLMEEAEGQPGEEGDAPEHVALQERWRQERLAHEAQLLYDDSEEEGSSGSSGDGAGASADAGLHWGLPLGLVGLLCELA